MINLRWCGSFFVLAFLVSTSSGAQTPVTSLVAIFSTLPDTRIGVGTGSFISSDGKVLTAFHVVDNAKSLEITYAGKPYTSITVLGVDPDHDLALLKVNDFDLHPAYLDLATSAPSFIGGESVTIYGHSAQVFNQTIPGTVSRNLVLSQEIRDPKSSQHIFALENIPLLPLNTVIFGGLSGGPVLRDGKVIGIVSGSLTEGGSIAWAMPVTQGSVDAMKQIGRPAGAFDWPAFRLMATNVHTLRAEITLSGSLARALDQYISITSVLSTQEAEMRRACRLARLGVETSLAKTEDLLRKSPNILLGSIPNDVQIDFIMPFASTIPACSTAINSLPPLLVTANQALESIGDPLGDFIERLPLTKRNEELTTEARSNLSRSIAEALRASAQFKMKVLSMPRYADDAPLSGIRDYFQQEAKVLQIFSADTGASGMTEAVSKYVEFDRIIETLFQADLPNTQ
ncbi:S1 family peptidase [Tunturiibacter psychrotolerans]|uniref:S1 family peptidase n=1 Tax=Tunturiibacter psychrotolerans TaxID=3069686 RepID=UPI003D19D9B4